ncbi:aldehyde-activating protein [Vibrio sp. T187]|uniref:GFA family protein n=1 Tax=Vibrio TaxID=662 RepID=UPI0010C9C1AB|nr:MULTISPECIES: GFA family protein [Vibrio]MBW3696162.1 aldehyde-activating protein [Vibrio sp. T187]
MTIAGSCLCGQVTFESKNTFKYFHLCHCKQCQKTTGSAHASNLFTSPDYVVWLTGQELVKRFDVPGRAISKAFCTECGCGVPYLTASGKLMVVPAGSLDGTPNLLPQDNIFCSEKASWYEHGIEAKQFDAFPE